VLLVLFLSLPVCALRVGLIQALGVMTYFIAICMAISSWIHVPNGEWEPTAQQVGELQQILQPYVNEQAIAWREQLPPWERYTIQYQGQLLDGKKVIFVNALCSKPPSQAAKELVYTFDGGACYFRLHWDPASKAFTKFSFNGYA
jgi:hypothetical protein